MGEVVRQILLTDPVNTKRCVVTTKQMSVVVYQAMTRTRAGLLVLEWFGGRSTIFVTTF
jgi:hypothetical protein